MEMNSNSVQILGVVFFCVVISVVNQVWADQEQDNKVATRVIEANPYSKVELPYEAKKLKDAAKVKGNILEAKRDKVVIGPPLNGEKWPQEKPVPEKK
jgi:NhaP-type Na+/H+ and K+/H+ antiporter